MKSKKKQNYDGKELLRMIHNNKMNFYKLKATNLKTQKMIDEED